jgi:hypothetical protein
VQWKGQQGLFGKQKSDGPYGKPKIDRFFFVAYSGGAFAGAATENPKRVKEILPVLTKPIRSQPGARAFAQQASLFGRSVGGARVIKLEITGPSLDLIQPTAQTVMRACKKPISSKSRASDSFCAANGNRFTPSND